MMAYSFNPRFLLADKFLCYLIVGAMVCFLSPQQMLWTCIFLFYPHHVHAYVSRHRVRPYGGGEIARILGLAAGLFWISTLLPVGIYLMFCGVVFLIHNYIDDMRLCGEKPDLMRFLTTLPALAIVISKQAELYYPYANIEAGAHIAAGLAALGLCGLNLALRRKAGFYELATLFFVALMCWFFAAGIDLHSSYVFGGVIIAHGISWLFKTGYRRWHQGQAVFRRYFLEAALLNIFFAGFYLYFAWHQPMPLTGKFIFSPNAFSTWGVVHSISTIRWDDYRGLFSASGLRRRAQAA